MSIRIIAVTGSVGAGKSTFCNRLKELGFNVVNADVIANEVLQQEKIKKNVIEEFGNNILNTNSKINKTALAAIAFKSKNNLKKLTKILYPEIKKQIKENIENIKRSDTKPILLEAPTLFEAECQDIADYIITIEAPLSVRAIRCEKNRGWNKEETARRDAFLIGEKIRKERSDYIIENKGEQQLLINEAEKLFEKIIVSNKSKI